MIKSGAVIQIKINVTKESIGKVNNSRKADIMKRTIIIIMAVAMLLSANIMAVHAEHDHEFVIVKQEEGNPNIKYPEVYIMLDRVTGVEYICTKYGVCPRYKPDGKLFTGADD